MQQVDSRMVASTVRFAPWVGDAYASGFQGVRTLLVGESHYGAKRYERPTVTSELIKALAFGERHPQSTRKLKRHPHYAKIMCAVMGFSSSRGSSTARRRHFWDQVAYYNFIQTFLEKPRLAPSAGAWARGDRPFTEVMRCLDPQIVVCFSKRNGKRVRALAGDMPVVVINHPSSGFSYAETNPLIAACYQAVRGGGTPCTPFQACDTFERWRTLSRLALPARGRFIPEAEKPEVLEQWRRLMESLDIEAINTSAPSG